jgi:phosphoglycolate phosphatase-like HAD superfamily hydrolase
VTPLLVLWDIDQTLLDFGGVGRAAYSDAFTRVTGRPFTMAFSFGGLTELAMMHAVLTHHGVEPEADLITTMFSHLAQAHRDRADYMAEHGTLLPGAGAALEALAAVPGVRQTVLTGNMQAVGELKIGLFGLDRWLDLSIGAFGDQDLERVDLLPRAWRNISRRYGESFTAAQTVVIGDTARDVEVAITHHAAVVAVATGSTTADALVASGARVVLPGLEDTQEVLAAIQDCVQRAARSSAP